MPSPVIVAPGHAVQSLQQGTERLDDHLFLTNQKIHDQSDLDAADVDDDDMPLVLVIGPDHRARGRHQPVAQIEQWQSTIADPNRQLAVDRVGARQVEIEDLDNAGQRQGKRLLAEDHHQGRQDGQRQRQLDRDLAARCLRSESISTVPFICAIRVLTTSMPTPRPETSEISALVEKPGAKIRL